MKIHYFEETDSLLMTFRDDATCDDSNEVFDGFVVDLDETGRPMGLDVADASKAFDIDWLRRHADRDEGSPKPSTNQDAPQKEKD
jgi:uncharacterized protein YuzE